MPPPLITFPPSTAFNPHSSIKPSTHKPRSTFNRICSASPLLFIATILLFTFYSFFLDLSIRYLLFQEGEWFRSLCYSSFFLWFWFGCSGSLIQAVVRGGGNPDGIMMSRRDEEEGSGGEFGIREGENDGLLSNEEGTVSLRDEEARSSRNGSTPNVDSISLQFAANVSTSTVKTSGLQLKADGRARYCQKCQLPKPDRSHHCSSCRRCVLKLDHHCPWLGGSCVGYGNYKFFLLFLWYSSALGIYCAAISIWELSRFVDQSGPDGFEFAPLIWAVTTMLGFIFGISLMFFGLYHFYLACNNRSTIEAMERSPTYKINPSKPNSRSSNRYKPDHALTRVERRRLAKAAANLHIYDLGVANNLAQVFGGWEYKWIWLLPIGHPPGDGTTFPINRDNLEKFTRITAEIRLSGDTSSDTESEGGDEAEDDIEVSDKVNDDDGWDTRTIKGRER